MDNFWQAYQLEKIRPDSKADPCPWCGCDAVVIDSKIIDFQVFGKNHSQWSAYVSCYKCGASSPYRDIGTWPHSLEDEYNCVDWENEFEVLNFAIKIWNLRS